MSYGLLFSKFSKSVMRKSSFRHFSYELLNGFKEPGLKKPSAWDINPSLPLLRCYGSLVLLALIWSFPAFGWGWCFFGSTFIAASFIFCFRFLSLYLNFMNKRALSAINMPSWSSSSNSNSLMRMSSMLEDVYWWFRFRPTDFCYCYLAVFTCCAALLVILFYSVVFVRAKYGRGIAVSDEAT